MKLMMKLCRTAMLGCLPATWLSAQPTCNIALDHLVVRPPLCKPWVEGQHICSNQPPHLPHCRSHCHQPHCHTPLHRSRSLHSCFHSHPHQSHCHFLLRPRRHHPLLHFLHPVLLVECRPLPLVPRLQLHDSLEHLPPSATRSPISIPLASYWPCGQYQSQQLVGLHLV